MTAESFRQHTRALLRARLVDAALAQAATTPWEKVRMSDVAADVGVSRQTVYNEFGSKDALAQSALMRVLTAFLDGIRDSLDAHEEFGDAIEAALGWTLRNGRGHPVIQRVLADAEHGRSSLLLNLLTIQSEAIIQPASAFVRDYVDRRWPERLSADGPALVDALVRLILSHILRPQADLDAAAASLATIINRATA